MLFTDSATTRSKDNLKLQLPIILFKKKSYLTLLITGGGQNVPPYFLNLNIFCCVILQKLKFSGFQFLTILDLFQPFLCSKNLFFGFLGGLFEILGPTFFRNRGLKGWLWVHKKRNKHIFCLKTHFELILIERNIIKLKQTTW